MPSYFYHLKFELYPHPKPTNSIGKQKELDNRIWLPPPGTKIFDTASWPKHTPFKDTQDWVTQLARETSYGEGLNKADREETGVSQPVRKGRGGVIDCGPARATPAA